MPKVKRPPRWQAPCRAGVILLVYGACAVLVVRAPAGALTYLLWPFMGFVLAGFLNAAHDCVHRTHLRGRRANRVAGALWSAPILVNSTLYKWQHLAHHRNVGVDGDTETHETFDSLGDYLVALSGASYWRSAWRSIARTLRGRFPDTVSSPDRRADARTDNRLVLGWLGLAVALTVLSPHVMLTAYWAPLLFVPAATTILSLPEHYGLSGVPEVVANTRSVRSNAVVRFFQWNANYHAEHHAAPSTPSLALHRLHESAQLGARTEESYLSFHLKLLGHLVRRSGRREPVQG